MAIKFPIEKIIYAQNFNFFLIFPQNGVFSSLKWTTIFLQQDLPLIFRQLPHFWGGNPFPATKPLLQAAGDVLISSESLTEYRACLTNGYSTAVIVVPCLSQMGAADSTSSSPPDHGQPHCTVLVLAHTAVSLVR